MKVEKREADSEEISVGERAPELVDVEDFSDIKRTWKQNVKELNWDLYERTVKNTHGEIKKREHRMGARSQRLPN